MCLLRLRIAPLIPVEVWDRVIFLIFEPKNHAQSQRILHRFGYAMDGTIRMQIQPLILPCICKGDVEQLRTMLCSEDQWSFRNVALMLGASTKSAWGEGSL